MLVRVSDPDRLVDLIVFLHNSGFPLARRESEDVAELFSQDEPKGSPRTGCGKRPTAFRFR